MEYVVGQKVYVRENANNFKLLSYSGDVIYIDNIQELILVRFKNSKTAFFSESNLSLNFILPSLTSIISAMFIFALFSYCIAYFANIVF